MFGGTNKVKQKEGSIPAYKEVKHMDCRTLNETEQKALTIKVRQLKKEYEQKLFLERRQIVEQALASSSPDLKEIEPFLKGELDLIDGSLPGIEEAAAEAKLEWEKLVETESDQFDPKAVEQEAKQVLDYRKTELEQKFGIQDAYGADVLANASGMKKI